MSFATHLKSLALVATCLILSAQTDAQEMTYSLAIHGGAGTITRDRMTPELEAAYREKLTEALRAGQTILAKGGAALDAVSAAITVMEDSPLFNAGKGAVFTNEGRNELDAAIMDGATLNAGAVTGVTRIRNPILLARAVMDKSPHVMLAQEGAEEFAREQGFELVNPLYFWTERRFKSLLAVQAEDSHALYLDHDETHKYGTVGAVALDAHGNLAAGTSTGGLTNKMWGRIGDSPIIGAGTYASNRSCAVSGTGTGEYYIRLTLAREVCALMEYTGAGVQQAADTMIHERLTGLGGDGGIIVVDKDGNIAMSFNTEGMYRGRVTSAAPEPVTAIYKDE
ncbi:MAG: isoaspartyl peptidase/L-asparaginase [Alphaproteobacteria bacterium]|nr:MAG: isoaspartyl peptidase/L-asparaginase [Alphaproteobacteria bacterium]